MSKQGNKVGNKPAEITNATKKEFNEVKFDVPDAIVVPVYPTQKVTLGKATALKFGRSEVDFSTATQAELNRLHELGSPLVTKK